MFRTVFAATLLLATPAAAQQLTPDQTAKVDQLVAQALQSTQVPSASVAIVRDGKVVFAKAYGDQGPGMKATSANARYQIASISKQFTAAAILLRRRTDWHRRLHVCGMAMLTGPAFGRLLPMPLLIPYAGWAVFAALMVWPAIGIVGDLRRRGRVHPAWWWGVGAMLATQMAMSLIAHSPLGVVIYEAVTAGTPGAQVAPLDFPPPPTGPLITGR